VLLPLTTTEKIQLVIASITALAALIALANVLVQLRHERRRTQPIAVAHEAGSRRLAPTSSPAAWVVDAYLTSEGAGPAFNVRFGVEFVGVRYPYRLRLTSSDRYREETVVPGAGDEFPARTRSSLARTRHPRRQMTASTPLAIEATGLVKDFGSTRAVDGVDLSVRRGSVYGVLGPNGAGKTTTIRMLATLIRPDAGSARVLGHDIVDEADAVRGLVTLTGQLASVDEDLTGRENLVLIARLLGLKRAQAKARADELLGAFGIADAAGRLVKHYSGGMRRRLDLAASIVVTPQLMFLDEPTTGLDPRSRNQVWDIIRCLVAEGTTILLCTQYLDEADQLADGIAVIDHGRVIAEGTPGQLKASVGSGSLRVRLLDPDQRPLAERVLAGDLGGVHLEADPAALSAQCADSERAAEAVAELSSAGVGIAGFSLGQPTLDEVFLALTGHPAEEHGADEAAVAGEEQAA
jgi:ABC-2 type transport system ATP-binding protein